MELVATNNKNQLIGVYGGGYIVESANEYESINLGIGGGGDIVESANII